MTLPRDEELHLIEQAQRDPHAFGELYDHYVGQIYRFIFSRVHNHEVAEDITAEVFLKALRAIGRYTPGEHPLSAWLYQISAHAITDHYRSARPTSSIDTMIGLNDNSRPISEEIADRDEAGRLWSMIDTLPEQQRLAITLKLSEDLKISQIGAIMGKTEGAVKLLIHRGMTTLRARIRESSLSAEESTS